MKGCFRRDPGLICTGSTVPSQGANRAMATMMTSTASASITGQLRRPWRIWRQAVVCGVPPPGRSAAAVLSTASMGVCMMGPQ
ncbi:hypothetical protein WJ970_10195 [Achromobacter xylosoxidans]